MKTSIVERPHLTGGLVAALLLPVLALVLAVTAAPTGAETLPGGSLDPTTIRNTGSLW